MARGARSSTSLDEKIPKLMVLFLEDFHIRRDIEKHEEVWRWLPPRDSNPDWTSQSRQSYH